MPLAVSWFVYSVVDSLVTRREHHSSSIINFHVLIWDARNVIEQVLVALADRPSSRRTVGGAGDARLCNLLTRALVGNHKIHVDTRVSHQSSDPKPRTDADNPQGCKLGLVDEGAGPVARRGSFPLLKQRLKLGSYNILKLPRSLYFGAFALNSRAQYHRFKLIICVARKAFYRRRHSSRLGLPNQFEPFGTSSTT